MWHVRGSLAALALLAILGGCLDDGDGPAEPGAPAASVPGYALDCSIATTDVPAWAEPCLAWASRNESPSKTEIDLAVNPTDPMNVFVASKDLDPLASPGPCVWAVGQASHDGGHTWETVYVGGTMAERALTDTLYGWRCITDPILQYAPDGTLHYSLQAYDYEPGGVETPGLGTGFELEGGNMYTALSTDGGSTFPTIELMHAGDELAVFHDFMRMGVSPASGTVFTLWNQITGVATRLPVLVATEADGSVRPPVYLAVPSAPGLAGINSIVGTPDGAIHAFVTAGGEGGTETFMQATSTDDGRTFGLAVPVFSLTTMPGADNIAWRTGTNVEVVADTSGGPWNGCMYAVWADGARDEGDIEARRSCDGGAEWESLGKVADGDHAVAMQVFPRVSVDGLGTVHVVYQTQAYDPGHRLVDADWAHSTDGGVTWSVARLTRHASDGDLGLHQNGGSFFGDYIGIGSSGDHTYMAFPVTVTGRTEIAVAHVVAHVLAE